MTDDQTTAEPVIIDPAILHDTVASRLKRVRVALNLKSAEMAKHIGIGGSKYSNLETGKAKLSDEEFASIDLVLAQHGVPAGWLKGDGFEPPAAANVPAPAPNAPVMEVWDFSSEALLGELGRRLALLDAGPRIETEVPGPSSVPEAPVEHGVQVVEPGQPVPPPADPVAPPAVDVPLPLPVAPVAELPTVAVAQVSEPVIAPLPPAALPPVVAEVAVAPAPVVDPLAAIVGAPAVTPPTSSFDQPVAVEVGERPLMDVLIEQYGPAGVPPVAFVPPTPAAV